MIKCIASDMDGTLLNANQEVTKFNRDAIQLAQRNGIEFLVATGRSWKEARHALDIAGIVCPAICVNGGEIRDENGNVLHSIGMNGDISTKVTEVLNNAGLYYEIYTHSNTYTTEEEKGIQALVDIIYSANPTEDIEEIRKSVQDRFTRRLIHVVDSYDEIFADPHCHVHKFLVFSMDDQLLDTASEKLKKIKDIAVTSSGRHNIEINHIQAQKGLALQAFTELKGISLAETMAIGDNYNDVSMLTRVGCSVAMGNADQEIKDLSRCVTDTNEENGVGKAIIKALKEMNIV